MWDNRENKRNPRAPDYKCKDRACDGAIWPPRDPNAEIVPAVPAGTPDDPPCPVCGGKMWDDRASKRNPRAPDFKCRNKPKVMGGPGCPGIIWPPRDGERRPANAAPSARSAPSGAPRRPAALGRPPVDDTPPPDDRDFPDDDDLPF